MAEKIKLLELDINVNQLVKSATEAKTVVNNLKTELKELQKEPVKNAEEIERLNAQLKNANTTYREASNVLAKYTEVNDVNNLSIKEARNQLAAVSVLWANEAKLNGENTEKAKDLAEAKSLLTDKLKAEEKATGDTRRNVGNYTESIKEAIASSGLFGSKVTSIINTLTDLKDGLQAAKEKFTSASSASDELSGATNAVSGNTGKFIKMLGSLKGAIAATGIGLLVLAVAGLISILTKITPIVDKFEQGLAAVKAVIDVVVGSIVSLVTGAKSLGDAFDGLGGKMKEAAKAAVELKKAQQDLEDAMQGQEIQNAKIQGQIDALIIQSKDRTRSEKERLGLIAEAEKLEKENFEQRKKIAQDELLIITKQIRIKAGITKAELSELRTRHKNEEEFFNAFKELAEKRTTNVDDMFGAFQKSMIGYYGTLNEHNKFTEKQISSQNKIIEKAEQEAEKSKEQRQKNAEKAEQERKKQEEEKKKQQDLMIKSMQEELELTEALAGKKIKSENQIADAYNKRLAILDKQREYDLISETKYQTELAKLQDEFYDQSEDRLLKLAERSIKAAEEELALLRLTHESKIEDGQLLTEELIQQEIDRLIFIKDAAEEIERQKFLSGQITADEFRAYQLEAEKGFLETQAGLRAEHTQQLNDAKAIDFANEIAILEENGTYKYEIQKLQLQQQYDEEIASAEKTGADKNKIETKYALLRKKIDEQEKKDRLKSISDTFGTIAELLGKNTVAGKAAAVAQAGINTYLGVSQILAAPPSGPEPANSIIKGVAIAGTIATGIANVAKIVAIKDKFADGGVIPYYISGSRITNRSNIPTQYNGDNILATVRSGEVVLNESQQAMLGGANTFKRIGVPGFADGGIAGGINDGGYLQRSLLEGMDITSTIVQAVGAAFNNTTIVTKVTDVISETGKYNSLVDGASL
jgi:hypothetical protein